MQIDLKRFFSGEDVGLPISYPLDLSGIELNGMHPFSKPVGISGKLESKTNLVTLDLTARVFVRCPCDRCAEEVDISYDVAVFYRLVPELNQDGNDDFLLVDSMLLDIDRLVREAALLNYPTKLLCCDSCKGICQTCGCNFNRRQCGCEKKQIDPRLEALKKLID